MTKQERDNLILDNRGIVGVIAKKAFNLPHVRRSLGTLQDAFQAGMVALCRAANNFDSKRLARSGPRKGKPVAFGTYAGRAIWNEITKTAASEGVIKVPTDIFWQTNISKKYQKDIIRASETKQLGSDFACDVILSKRITPLDEAADNELKEDLRHEISRMHKHYQQVLLSCFGFTDEGSQTLENLGKKFGISKERVRQIKVKALARLKDDVEYINRLM